MAENNRVSFLGCLGTLVGFTFIGSLLFGGGISFRVGNFAIGFDRGSKNNQPENSQPSTQNYFIDLKRSEEVAEAAVKRVRNQIDQGKCSEMYDEASDLFKKNAERASTVNFCSALKQQLGSMTSAQLTDWWGQPAAKDSERYILMRYTTKFSKGTVRESFMWLVSNDKAQLVNFEIFPQSAIQQPTPLTEGI